MTTIRRILVANRGEIARRIMRTCKRMGIDSVAVFSDADAKMPFVREADRAVRIGPGPSATSYLSIDRILAAATKSGADAIHPGYGFLAENADFADACTRAGLCFIGPPADVIRAMGSKRAAKRIVAAAGIPVVPGYIGDVEDTEALVRAARDVGFPCLVKASAGGGGRGMRIVREIHELTPAIESARREALAAFGDGTLLIERYIESPRHIEFQILGDAHGNLVHLFERECSIQRRHQKIIEETPSPALDGWLRRAMGEAAVRVGRAIGYRNAGTVEFVLAPDRSFHFLEVNARLQVEHPITESTTGLDLVREQIRIARGEPLGFAQDDIVAKGAAVEARLCAEDPSRDFLPSSGRIVDFHLPTTAEVRVDSGIETGSIVGVDYDSMLAKVVAHASTRSEAIGKLAHALQSLSVQGVRTNRRCLVDILEHPAFCDGNYATDFIERHGEVVREKTHSARNVARAIVCATLSVHERRRPSGRLESVTSGFRNNPTMGQRVAYETPNGTIEAEYRNLGRGQFEFRVNDTRLLVALVGCTESEIAIEEQDGLRFFARVAIDGLRHYVHVLGESIAFDEIPRFPAGEKANAPGACVAPVPGKIAAVLVERGARVARGQRLVVLEAMKMEHAILAHGDGVVGDVKVCVGDFVREGAVIVVMEALET